MKCLTIVRHAKSSWDFHQLDDFERPLNSRGNKNAPVMAERIQKEIQLPELILCSSAKRTKETLAHFLSTWKIEPSIDYVTALYLAELGTIETIIHNIPSNINNAMLIGHNPGLTDLVNHLGQNRLDNMPTCGVMQLQFDCEWNEISEHSGNMSFWSYPKAH